MEEHIPQYAGDQVHTQTVSKDARNSARAGSVCYFYRDAYGDQLDLLFPESQTQLDLPFVERVDHG